MLARIYRLKAKDFRNVKTKGQLFPSAHLGTIVLKRKDSNESHFGCIISTNVSKLSTQRNRIKRAIMDGIRQNFNHIPQGFDCIFLPKRSMVEKSGDEIKKDVGAFIIKLTENL